MRFQNILLIVFLVTCSVTITFAQNKTVSSSSPATTQAVKSSPAYAELLLRKVELESEMESLLITYKEDFPKVKETKYELGLMQKDLDRLLIQTDATKLTLALGKLMVRKNQLETDYWVLQGKYGDDYPEVKRSKRKVLSFQNAIKEILP